MAVTATLSPNESIESQPRHYFGISTDMKPTVASHGALPTPTVGSDFSETDTGIKYVTGNGTDWVVDLLIKAMSDLKDAISDLRDTMDETLASIELETKKIRFGHELHLWEEPVEVPEKEE